MTHESMKRVFYSTLFGMLVVLIDMLLVFLVGITDSGELKIGFSVTFIVLMLHFVIAIPAMFFVGKSWLCFVAIFIFWGGLAFFFLNESRLSGIANNSSRRAD